MRRKRLPAVMIVEPPVTDAVMKLAEELKFVEVAVSAVVAKLPSFAESYSRTRLNVSPAFPVDALMPAVQYISVSVPLTGLGIWILVAAVDVAGFPAPVARK